MEKMALDVNKMTKDQLRQHILMLAMQLTQLEKENKKLKDKIKDLTKYKRKYFQFYNIDNAVDENIKLKEENELLKQCLDEMMFKADVINITIHGELGDYVYVRSDKQLKLNVEK